MRKLVFVLLAAAAALAVAVSAKSLAPGAGKAEKGHVE